jgi:short chain dehydrogenase
MKGRRSGSVGRHEISGERTRPRVPFLARRRTSHAGTRVFPQKDSRFQHCQRKPRASRICLSCARQPSPWHNLDSDDIEQKILSDHGQRTTHEFLLIGLLGPRTSADAPVGEHPPDKNVVGSDDHPLFACSMKLNRKIAVITGASLGIGRAPAIAMATEGVHLVLTARSSAKLRELAKTFWQVTGRCR